MNIKTKKFLLYSMMLFVFVGISMIIVFDHDDQNSPAPVPHIENKMLSENNPSSVYNNIVSEHEIQSDGLNSEEDADTAIAPEPSNFSHPEEHGSPNTNPKTATLEDLTPEELDNLKRYNYPLYLEILANSGVDENTIDETPEEAEAIAVEGALSILEGETEE